MPEGPEVRIMTEDNNMTYDILYNIKFYKRSKINKKNIKNFSKIKYPQEIKKHYNIGKEIFIVLEKYIIIINLGFGKYDNYKNKYTIIEFELLNNKKTYINDMRKFSSFDIIKKEEFNNYINNLGYDPLHHNINFEKFYNNYILKYNSKQDIYKKLLDQRIFAGCGNYIRCELIYDSKVDPFCDYNKITKRNWKRIFKSYNKIVKKSYKLQNNFSSIIFNVYRRVDKNDVIKIKDNNRTFWYSTSIKYYKC